MEEKEKTKCGGSNEKSSKRLDCHVNCADKWEAQLRKRQRCSRQINAKTQIKDVKS